MEIAPKKLKSVLRALTGRQSPSIPENISYHRVEGSGDSPLDPESEEFKNIPLQKTAKTSARAKLRRFGILFAKAIFWVFFCFETWWFSIHWGRDFTIFGKEHIYLDPPVMWEFDRLERAGFHDTRHNGRTEFEGAPNAQNNAAWGHILNVGVVAISKYENSRLTNSSAQVVDEPSKYVVQLELFHQLHCLKWIRDQFWDLNEAITTGKQIHDFPQRVDHTDHCIDYLRQILMCHGDITPMTFEWSNEIGGYLAHHSTEHMCRNFDAIYEWAARRNTTGLAVDGKHQNVELQVPEGFD